MLPGSTVTATCAFQIIPQPEEDKLMQWAMLSLTAVATVFCLWRRWDLFNIDRADMAEGFPLKQGLKRIMFPFIVANLLFFQVVILTDGSENLSSRYLYMFFPTFMGVVSTIRAHRNYRRRIAGKPLPADRNDLVTLKLLE